MTEITERQPVTANALSRNDRESEILDLRSEFSDRLYLSTTSADRLARKGLRNREVRIER